MSEDIVLGKVDVRRKADVFMLYFTTRRLIAAKLGSAQAGVAWFILGPLGPLAGTFLAMRRQARKAKEIDTMLTEGTLKAGKDNFAIEYQEITKVKVEQGKPISLITIFCSDRKQEFILPQRNLDEATDLLRRTLGSKLSIT